MLFVLRIGQQPSNPIGLPHALLQFLCYRRGLSAPITHVELVHSKEDAAIKYAFDSRRVACSRVDGD
jgi:hypothetical protein